MFLHLGLHFREQLVQLAILIQSSIVMSLQLQTRFLALTFRQHLIHLGQRQSLFENLLVQALDGAVAEGSDFIGKLLAFAVLSDVCNKGKGYGHGISYTTWCSAVCCFRGLRNCI